MDKHLELVGISGGARPGGGGSAEAEEAAGTWQVRSRQGHHQPSALQRRGGAAGVEAEPHGACLEAWI